jgi:catechol 2,3-dioxygenase-like lactoylglutathione lyase family enzyme
MIRGLHHAAYRCRDSEETRAFYEGFLGLPLVNAFEISSSKSGRAVHVLHSFYAMADGSCIAFFEDPTTPFDFKAQHDYDLHIALEVARDELQPMLDKGRRLGIEARGIADHAFIDSVYFRDPNGYIVELTAKQPNHADAMDPTKNHARERLATWQSRKPSYDSSK